MRSVANLAERPPTPNVQLNLYNSQEFFRVLNDDIAETGPDDRIGILTFYFDPGDPLVAPIVENLHVAADRGAEVKFGVDAYTFMIDHKAKSVGPMYPILPFRRSIFKPRKKTLEELGEHSSVECAVINEPKQGRIFHLPVAGRSHLKIVVINNKVMLGGQNLHDSDRLDMAVGFEHSSTADYLYDLISAIISEKQTSEVFGNEDQLWRIDNFNTLIVDAGLRSQSTIMELAHQLIDEAQEELYLPFQYFPDTKTLARIAEAHERGVDLHVAYNHAHQHGFILGALQKIQTIRQQRTVPAPFLSGELPSKAPNLHTKAVVSERAAMLGTHNHASQGPRLGTAEIDLHSSDSKFASRVGAVVMAQIEYANQF